MPGRRRIRRFVETTLDENEQGELAVKVRYGIGLEVLLGEHGAARSRRLPLQRSAITKRPKPPIVERPADQVRARAAELGLGAGARGQWLRR